MREVKNKNIQKLVRGLEDVFEGKNIDPDNIQHRSLPQMIGYNLELNLNYGTYPAPPYTKHESRDEYSLVKQLFENTIANNFDLRFLKNKLSKRSQKELLLLQGMRITEGSTFEMVYFPNFKLLKDSANQQYNEFLTHLARAIAKHSRRCEVNYWGNISGSPQEQNRSALVYLENLLNTFTWWNYFTHFKHGIILEIRDITGHGMRWAIHDMKFLGLVEPIDPNLGRIFWVEPEPIGL